MKGYHIGFCIRRKREEQGVSQSQLCYGICDRTTLSRIECGKQEPSYSVLKMLLQRLGMSGDRCQILMGPQEFAISELQEEIVADNVQHDFSSALKKIRRLEELFQPAENPILQQFVLRVRALAGYEKNGERSAYTYPVRRKILIRALELTCPGITMENLDSFLLGEDEAKIINQIAISYSEEGNRRQAIEIYRQLIRYVQSHFASCEIGEVMLPLTAYNYSRLLGLERRYEESIEIAELGRQSCVKYNKCRFLGGLLLNIACCLHELGNDEKSKKLLLNSYYAYLIMEDFVSCKVVQEYAEENLGMKIS